MINTAFLADQTPFAESKIVILPIPYEKTTSYIHGTALAPRAILHASREVEFYDEEADAEVFYKTGIHTLPQIPCNGKTEQILKRIESTAEKHIKKNKFLVSIGGEHTITYPLVKAHSKHFKNLSVLIIDAHADLRSEYQGSPFSHACAAYLIRNIANITLTGIRAYSEAEAQLIKRERINTFPSFRIHRNRKWIDDVLHTLTENVYVSVDLDGIDPSLMPSVGTPVPGGLTWEEATNLLRRVSEKKLIVGMDFVELCPSKYLSYSDFTAAKLIYKAICYVFSGKK
ncbi:MAG TPA: agmatinase [bacterium]